MSAFDVAAARALIERRTVSTPRGFITDCWIWTGCALPSGYGKLRIRKADWLAHRLAHAAFTGPIPASYQVDHLCQQKDCCNPAHLEAVTPLTNTVRALIANGQRLSADVCKLGHARTPDNLRKGRCRICYDASVRRWTQKNRPRKMPVRKLAPVELRA